MADTKQTDTAADTAPDEKDAKLDTTSGEKAADKAVEAVKPGNESDVSGTDKLVSEQAPSEVYDDHGEREGQAQEATPYPTPHDGTHFFHEVASITDRIIKDVRHPLAVQVPEGVGASHAGHRSPLGEALATGTPEEQFGRSQAEADKTAADSEPDTKS